MNTRIMRLPIEREPAAFLDTLCRIVGPAHVLTDPAATHSYTTDWTGRWEGSAIAVVRPGNTREVSAVTAACFAARIPITPQGGNTGVVGGGVPASGSILLSTRRLAEIEAVNPRERTIAAGAGVTVAEADHAAADRGLRFGIDLASKESATLGGIVATNAGGMRRIRYGDARSQLLGIEAVMSDGSILSRWYPLSTDNIGYDLPGLLAGSEGTLGIITKVLMKLASQSRDTRVLIAGVTSVSRALRLHDQIVRHGLTVEAAELMTSSGVDLVCEHANASQPLHKPAPLYTLFEVSAHRGTESALLETLSNSADLIEDAILEPWPARKLWHLRENHTESIGRESDTPVVKLDVSVPLDTMSSFVTELESAMAADASPIRPILFGHFLDGSIHVNLLHVPPADVEAVTDAVFNLVAAHRGSISAEHGIGRAKSPWVHLGRTPIDVHTMNRIKSALDPRRILNPGVLLPQ